MDLVPQAARVPRSRVVLASISAGLHPLWNPEVAPPGGQEYRHEAAPSPSEDQRNICRLTELGQVLLHSVLARLQDHYRAPLGSCQLEPSGFLLVGFLADLTELIRPRSEGESKYEKNRSHR